ncbi:hypothetical protein CY34DRAFT_811387 [Suillus luteus UH-Slu-Lm8-n1]|uniref:Uncharacterized protein n=1 Tax=Suillus luteus UH-Slu-Lm8-n1 TaxID=930992 RepID=A0A0C9ZFW8_9AGAM|nr:hypothetical protein CY34DRAFT_811387 [Suillus luteus UH-Slu-Lm8-n1]
MHVDACRRSDLDKQFSDTERPRGLNRSRRFDVNNAISALHREDTVFLTRQCFP